MIHDLYKHRNVLCVGDHWAQRLAILDGYTLPIVGQLEDMPDDDDLDIFGDPIPKPRMDGDKAIIPIKGAIVSGIPKLLKAFGFVDANEITDQVMRAANNPGVKGIVLDFDSPGGSVGGTPELASSVAEAESMKPVVSVVGPGAMMDSAAYWVAAGSKMIIASPSSDVGSIGVWTVLLDLTAARERDGLNVQVFRSGDLKAPGLLATGLSDAMKREIQASVDSIGATFRAFVGNYRKKIDRANMEGQTFMGEAAKAAGLVDQLASSYSAGIEAAKKAIDVSLR